jgi:putative hydrolase of the HAD superfamily
MQKIKNIIFDLGGIFINIDFARTEKAFRELGVANFNVYFTQHHASNLFELLETGKVSTVEFCEAFRKETGINLSNDQIIQSWNALLLDFPIERIKWLDKIREKYNVYLFSNTNQIHYEAFIESFTTQTGLNHFNSYFIKAYYSHEMGLRKPYPESFQYILNEQNLVAEETLFIDDTLKNVEGAKAVGLQTIHLAPPLTVLNLPL